MHFGQLNRRKFISLIGGMAAAWPLEARAQQATSPKRVGFLLAGLSPESREVEAFRRELRKAGYIEGRNLVMEWRSANGDYDRVPALVADLIQSNVDVMVHDSTFGTQVAKRATSAIPIVMALVLDPIGSGLVENLAHPGGNITGLSMMATELYPKRLQLLKEIKPQLARAAVWWNPDHPFHPKAVEEIKAAAPSLSIELSFASVRKPEQFAPAFSDITRANAQALYVVDDPVFFAHREILLNLASAARLPTDPSKVHRIDHRGKYFSVRGPLPALPSPQHRPVIIQDGLSGPGMDLAAHYADLQFTTRRTMQSMNAHRAD